VILQTVAARALGRRPGLEEPPPVIATGGVGVRYDEATALTDLGDTHHTTGDAASAATAWTQAIALLDTLLHPRCRQSPYQTGLTSDWDVHGELVCNVRFRLGPTPDHSGA
jgi:hypothetical protein